VSRFIDMFRALFGVEPICRTLGVSASAYWRRATGERSARRLEDERLTAPIAELHEANYGAYGYRRMWRALTLSGEDPGRDQVARLMRRAGLEGAKRPGSRRGPRNPILWRTGGPIWSIVISPPALRTSCRSHAVGMPADRLLERRADAAVSRPRWDRSW
jgi:hypothetical protein